MLMPFMLSRGEASWCDEENVVIEKELPLGFWHATTAQMRGSYFEKAVYDCAHGKIYGNSEEISNHIVERFERVKDGRNFGVLMSGGKGLGKSLTLKLCIEKLKDKYPIVFVDAMFGGLPEMLNQIKNCVVIMDEFEKTMEEKRGDQELLLSILDGKTNGNNNLYLFTVNNVYRIDENLKSRPGRIMYHYKFKSVDTETMRNYFEENLNDKSKVDEIIEALDNFDYLSMDILTAVASEMNVFPDVGINKILGYLNVESTSVNVKTIFHFTDCEGKETTEEDISCGVDPNRPFVRWVNDDDWQVRYAMPQRLTKKLQKVPFEITADRTKDNYELEEGEVYPVFGYVEVCIYEDNFYKRAAYGYGNYDWND